MTTFAASYAGPAATRVQRPGADEIRSGPQSGVAGFAVDAMEAIGGAGAGLLVAAENLFPPIPSEAILPIAGFAASQGVISLWGAIVWTTLGSVLGALALFFLGRRIGRARLVALLERMPLMKVADLERTERWFARHGDKAVLLGRMVPVFRSLISIPAGIERMNLGLFTLYSALGSVLWNTLFVFAGVLLGENFHRISDYADLLTNVVVALILAFLLVWAVLRLRRNARRRRDPSYRPLSADEASARMDALLQQTPDHRR